MDIIENIIETKTEDVLELIQSDRYAAARSILIDMNEVNRIVQNHVTEGRVGISIYDVKNDVFYNNMNAEDAMPASALINVPILYTVSQQLDDGSLEWNDRVLFQTEFGGRGSSPEYQDGEWYTVRDLTDRMLRFSHNDAVNSLLDYFGYDGIRRECRDHSYLSVNLQRHLAEDVPNRNNYVSAEDTTKMLAEMYLSDGEIDKDYLINHFYISDDTARSGLGKYLPHDVLFLNQNVVNTTIHNETAIIISDDSEYIITVLCYDGDAKEFKAMGAEVSEYVYDALNQ